MDDVDGVEDALGIRVPDDDRLWVRLKPDWTRDPQWKWRIFGNAHTFPGRFHVCAIGHDDEHRTVDMQDVAEVSPDARLWLSGFLAGQEVSQFVFMGCSDDLLDAITADDQDRWREWNAACRRRGRYWGLDTIPEEDEPALAEVHDPPAWVFVAAQFWVYSTAGWAPADPQPTPFSVDQLPLWPGSVCAERGHHDMDLEVGNTVICAHCHTV